MCNKAVRDYPSSLRFILVFFVTQQQVKLWHQDYDYCNDDKLIGWYDGYKKRKTQKAKIKDELMLIAWRLSYWWSWCVPWDEKKETEKLW